MAYKKGETYLPKPLKISPEPQILSCDALVANERNDKWGSEKHENATASFGKTKSHKKLLEVEFYILDSVLWRVDLRSVYANGANVLSKYTYIV